MVNKILERMIFVQSGEFALDATFIPGKSLPSLLICPGIFEYGCSISSPIANEIAFAAAYADHASLRFAWRGQEASQGDLPTKDDLQPLFVDLESAYNHLQETVQKNEIVIVALRDSAKIALEYCSRSNTNVDCIILIDPPARLDFPEKKPVFAFFPGNEPVPKLYACDPPCRVYRIPKADKSFRRNLNLLGEQVVKLLKTP